MPDPFAPEPKVAVGPWTRRTRRVAYDNPWVTVWHDEVDRPDGSPGIYGVIHFENLAAGVVVLDAEDRVLLVGQHRYTLDAYSWEIPEGGVPAGESPLDGARRELLEETGVEADDWRELVRFHLSNSVSDEAGVVFAARAVSHGVPAPEPTEQLAIRWLPFDEALAMTADGRITDAMTIMGVGRVALERATGSPGPATETDQR
ncbi:MAG: NUDIX hydrolase [Chloroflexi bacterium]|nr:NUDIX hydrolase [Chloroflexota bacterium]